MISSRGEQGAEFPSDFSHTGDIDLGDLCPVCHRPDIAAAQAVGIRVDHVYMITFGLVGILSGLSGGLLTPIYRVFPTVGALLTIKAFAIVVLGGMGNLFGALVGSFVIGISESLAVMFISSDWKDLVAFAIMILILIIRPSGIIGGE